MVYNRNKCNIAMKPLEAGLELYSRAGEVLELKMLFDFSSHHPRSLVMLIRVDGGWSATTTGETQVLTAALGWPISVDL